MGPGVKILISVGSRESDFGSSRGVATVVDVLTRRHYLCL